MELRKLCKLLDQLLQLGSIGAGKLADLLLVLDEHKRGHAGHIVEHGQLLAIVDVDLGFDMLVIVV